MNARVNMQARQGWRAGILAASVLALGLAAGCGKKQEAPKKADSTAVAPVPPAGLGSDTYGQRIPGTESPVPQPQRPQFERLTIPAGTSVAAALQTSVSTGRNQVGDRVTLRTTTPIRVRGRAVVPAGSKVVGRVTHVRRAGRVKGGAELTLRFSQLVTPDGKTYAITAAPFRAVSKGSGKGSAAMIGGGAAAGGVIGGVLGGKKNVLPGAAIGGILGTTAAVATKGKQIVLPAGQRLTVEFTEPLGITVAAR